MVKKKQNKRLQFSNRSSICGLHERNKVGERQHFSSLGEPLFNYTGRNKYEGLKCVNVTDLMAHRRTRNQKRAKQEIK